MCPPVSTSGRNGVYKESFAEYGVQGDVLNGREKLIKFPSLFPDESKLDTLNIIIEAWLAAKMTRLENWNEPPWNTAELPRMIEEFASH